MPEQPVLSRRQRRLRSYVRAEILSYRDELDGRIPASWQDAEKLIEKRMRARYTVLSEIDWKFILELIAKLLPLILLFLEEESDV